MAFQKTVDAGYGTNLTYHRITQIAVDEENGTASVTIGAYVNKTKRESGAMPIMRYSTHVDADSNPLDMSKAQDVKALLYVWLKAHPTAMDIDFSGATDV